MNPQQLILSGKRAREIVSSTNSPLIEERQRVLRSAVKDLLPNEDEIHGAVLEGCLFLLKAEESNVSNNLKSATISALNSQLRRSYNDQTVLKALCFAEGFSGIEDSQLSQSRVKAVQNSAPIEGLEMRSPTYSASESHSFIATSDTQASKMQSPHKWLVAGSILLAVMAVSVLGVVTLKLLETNNAIGGSDKEDRESDLRQRRSPESDITLKGSNSVDALRQSQLNMEDLGYAIGGQKIQLDLGSIKALPDSSNVSFKYKLGNENISSLADCGRREWMTYPEKQWHSPQSTATERMLSRVCDGFMSVGPDISSSGAAIVFDPPSNIRTTPNGAILCSITSKGTIPIQGKRGDWYETNYCGSLGFIHKGQLKF